MDYAKHRPIEINQTQFWDVRFDRGSSQILTMLATFGLIGTGLFLTFIVSLMLLSLKMLITERVHAEWKMTFVAFSAWLVLVFGIFTYSSNFTLSFLFWILSAVLLSQTGKKIQVWEFSKNPRFALLTAFLFVLVNVGLLTVMFVSVSRYASELTFANAVQADHDGEGIDAVLAGLETATKLNKLSDIFARNLAHARLLKIGEELQNPAVNPADLASLVEGSYLEAERAVSLSPNNVVNYSLLGDIFRELAPLASNADILAIQAYTQAIELSPSNPKYQVALGRAYLARVDQLAILVESEDKELAGQAEDAQEESLTLAVESFEKAVELKPDYASARYYLSLAFVRQGNLSDAIAGMESVAAGNPNDVGIAFQLGLLYLQQGRSDLAQASLERAVAIAPNYSNARWYLAAVYEQEGDIEAAIEQIQAVLDLNPENEAVEARLDRLKAGPDEVEDIPVPLDEGENDPTQLDPSEGTLGE
jgi:cytochrome c-type biogenesis protein CcmH/NrfG